MAVDDITKQDPQTLRGPLTGMPEARKEGKKEVVADIL